MLSQGLPPYSRTTAEAAAALQLDHRARFSPLPSEDDMRNALPDAHRLSVALVKAPASLRTTLAVRNPVSTEVRWAETGRGLPDTVPKYLSLGERADCEAPAPAVASCDSHPDQRGAANFKALLHL